MLVVDFSGRSCRKYRRYFDAYLDSELLVETTQDVIRHLDACPDCARDLEIRAKLKEQVRNAVAAEDAPAELKENLRRRFRSERGNFFGYDTARWMMAAAAVQVLTIASPGLIA